MKNGIALSALALLSIGTFSTALPIFTKIPSGLLVVPVGSNSYVQISHLDTLYTDDSKQPVLSEEASLLLELGLAEADVDQLTLFINDVAFAIGSDSLSTRATIDLRVLESVDANSDELSELYQEQTLTDQSAYDSLWAEAQVESAIWAKLPQGLISRLTITLDEFQVHDQVAHINRKPTIELFLIQPTNGKAILFNGPPASHRRHGCIKSALHNLLGQFATLPASVRSLDFLSDNVLDIIFLTCNVYIFLLLVWELTHIAFVKELDEEEDREDEEESDLKQPLLSEIFSEKQPILLR